jgi:polysaccharide biosynthesis protein PslJ
LSQLATKPRLLAAAGGEHRLPGPGWKTRVSAAIPDDSSGLLTAYLVLLMLIPSELVFPALGAEGTPAEVLVLCIVLWYIASWLLGRPEAPAGGRPIRIAMMLFALACLASFVAAMTRDITDTEILSADRGLIELVTWGGIIVVISQTVVHYDSLERLLRRAVLIGSVVGAIGVFEFYTGITITNYLHIPGLAVSSNIGAVVSRDGFSRPSSTAIQPIEFSVVMAMLLPFALHQALDPDRVGLVRKWLPVVLIAFSIPITVSRSGILAVGVALIVLVPTWSKSEKVSAAVFGVLGLVVLKVIAPGLLGTLGDFFAGMFGSSSGGTDLSVSTRTSAYSWDWQFIAARPIFGRGFFTFLPQLYRYDDNQYLTTLVETGFVGLASFFGLFLAGAHCAGSGRRVARDKQRRHLGQAMVASLAAALVSSVTFDSLSFPMFTGLLFFILGAAGSYRAIILADEEPALNLV